MSKFIIIVLSSAFLSISFTIQSLSWLSTLGRASYHLVTKRASCPQLLRWAESVLFRSGLKSFLLFWRSSMRPQRWWSSRRWSWCRLRWISSCKRRDGCWTPRGWCFRRSRSHPVTFWSRLGTNAGRWARCGTPRLGISCRYIGLAFCYCRLRVAHRCNVLCCQLR